LFIDPVPNVKDPSGCEVMNNIFIDCGGAKNTTMVGAYYITSGSNYKLDYNYIARGQRTGMQQ